MLDSIYCSLIEQMQDEASASRTAPCTATRRVAAAKAYGMALVLMEIVEPGTDDYRLCKDVERNYLFRLYDLRVAGKEID